MIKRIAAALLLGSLAFGSPAMAQSRNLTLALAGTVTAIDPHFHNLIPNNNIADHIFDKLAGFDATGIASAFRSGAGGLTGGDALGPEELVAQYQQAFDQWARNLDQVASSMDQLGRALMAARTLYEVAEKHATVRAR